MRIPITWRALDGANACSRCTAAGRPGGTCSGTRCPGRRRTLPALVVVSGFGAARILGRDAGLHLLEYEDAREEAARAVARVKIAPTPPTLPDAPAQRFSALTAELDRAPAVASVVRRYRLDASPLIRDVHGWRTGRQDLVLDGDFDLLGEVLGAAK